MPPPLAVRHWPTPTRALILAAGCAAGSWLHAAPAIRHEGASDAIAASAISAVEVFAGADALSTGRFIYESPSVPDVEMSTMRLPFGHYFTEEGHDVRWYLTGSAGYFRAEQDVTSPTLGYLGKYAISSLTGSLGPGCTLKLNDWLSLNVQVPIGYAYIEFEFDRARPPGDPYAGAVADWYSHAISFFPSSELKAQWRTGAWTYGASTRLAVLYAYEVRELDEVVTEGDVSTTSAVWRNGVFATYDSAMKMAGMPVRLHGGFARNDLFGDIQQDDFVNHFYEINAGIGLVSPSAWDPVTEVGLNFGYYFGDRLRGVSIGLTVGF